MWVNLMKLRINVRYFALFRELSGRSEEGVLVEVGATAGRVYCKLAETYAFPLGVQDVRVAVNDEFASIEQHLADGDRVVFIPPVSGG
jgi:molybdopterin-guanine dinucleotide biosynthesis protein A